MDGAGALTCSDIPTRTRYASSFKTQNRPMTATRYPVFALHGVACYEKSRFDLALIDGDVMI